MKRFIQLLVAATLLAALCNNAARKVSAAEAPDTPCIDSVVMAEQQPHQGDSALIWYDDFDDHQQQERYAEKEGELTDEVCFGDQGQSLCMRYPTGKHGIGGRKVFFGDSPANRPQTVRGKESFTDVYWRRRTKGSGVIVGN